MPHGKIWTAQESADLASAWLQVSEDEGSSIVRGSGQSADVFFQRVFDEFQDMCPETVDGHGTYGERGVKAVKNHWTDKTKAQVRKFNGCLNTVYNQKPTGVTDQQMINMAAAIIMGATDCMSYRHKEYKPEQ